MKISKLFGDIKFLEDDFFINNPPALTICVDSLSISEMQLMSWSAEQPSMSLSSSSAKATVVMVIKERRRKGRRDIIAVFILENSFLFR